MKPLSNILKDATSESHKKVSQHPFLMRYNSQDFLLEDHYLHLKELQHIYLKLSALLFLFHNKTSTNNIIELFYIEDLLCTHANIDKDLKKLEEILNHRFDNKEELLNICPATTAYCQYLNSITQPESLLAHCCIRWFGDAFGGQKIKFKIMQIIKKNAPVAFYNNALSASNLAKKINSMKESGKFNETCEANFIKESVTAFKYHENIFNQLEKKHQDYINNKKTRNKNSSNMAMHIGAGVGICLFIGAGIQYCSSKNSCKL